jgi:hypothetical protein
MKEGGKVCIWLSLFSEYMPAVPLFHCPSNGSLNLKGDPMNQWEKYKGKQPR